MLNKIDFDLLNDIVSTPGVPGYEARIRNRIIEEIKPLVDEFYTDNIGNLITVKKGTNNPDGKKVMVAAHMDEIGFMVSHVDDQGYLRFIPLGGFDPKTITSMRVIVHGKKDLVGVMGCKPIHSMSQEERNRVVKLDEYFIDLGLPAEEVKELVKPGDTVSRRQDLMMIGNMLNGKSLDDRICVYALIEMLKQLKEVPYDLYAVFTVQEEVGLRGAHVAAHGVDPDFGIALDVTVANDIPGISPDKKVTEMGKGAAVKLYDSGTICDYRMIEYLTNIAEENKIANQTEILPAGGTDTAGIQRMAKNGAIAGAISLPMRYLHQTTEMVHEDDVKAMVNLLTTAVTNINQFDWAHK
ncbi:M42 family metallopeptidase [Limibacter armeniacum]|uniref:M42 family metallopeptidase n=1 Tax=Limibacter armeniacum TaxID=466084 RepID=UPI002FE54BBE